MIYKEDYPYIPCIGELYYISGNWKSGLEIHITDTETGEESAYTAYSEIPQNVITRKVTSCEFTPTQVKLWI